MKLLWSLPMMVGIAGTALAAPPDGRYTVTFPVICNPGSSGPVAPIVVLNVTQGQLTGSVNGRQSQNLANALLKPDGSFTATSVGGNLNATAWQISGQFSGNSVSVTLAADRCGSGTAQGTLGH
jgi:hypothetical protein